MHAFSDYPSRFSLRPSCDYLSSRILTPPVVRRRLPQTRSSTLRKDRLPRPLSTSFIETVRAYGSGDSHTAAVYAGRHFKKEKNSMYAP
ncbi:hypothetical protein X975_25655, partial [Stegodyphus mimosarum]